MRRGASATEPVLCGPLGGAAARLSSTAGGGAALRGPAGEEHPAGDGAALLRALPR